ncbi:MAG: hypothetical protein AAFY02_18950, partial [Pseudomonadota bacterium]
TGKARRGLCPASPDGYEPMIAWAAPAVALAAILASLHHGIVTKRDPGPPAAGASAPPLDKSFPLRPYPALETLRGNDVLRDYFGADYIDAYVATKSAEMEAFYEELSPTEYAWYLQAD